MAKVKQQKNKNEISFLYKKLALGPELRGEDPKAPFPGGRIKQVFTVFGAEMNKLMRMNCWLFLFTLPIYFVTLWCKSYFATNAVSDLNFIGNIGMAYPGGADTLSTALVELYQSYQIIFYLLVPSIMILGLGLAGAFNILKALMWGEKVEKITKTFFKGIKKYWWKYLIVGTFDALLILALGSTFVYFLTLRAEGLANGGHWVLLIFVCIIEFLLFYVQMFLLPLMAELDVGFSGQIKDSLIFATKMAPIGIPLFIICVLPFGLFFVNNTMLTLILLILGIMFAEVLLGLIFTAVSQSVLDNVVTPLYNMSKNPKAFEKAEKAEKTVNKTNKPKPQDFKKPQNKGKK